MAGNIFAIARSGMDVEWQRVEVVAANLANVNTTRGPDGLPWAARTLVSGPRFAALMGGSAATAAAATAGTSVLGVQLSSQPGRRVHDPAHPHADAAGFVSYPNVDHVGEMGTLLGAARVYEANLAAFNQARSMFQRALEIGSRR